MTDQPIDPNILAIVDRVAEIGAELSAMKLALLSLGSNIAAGGAPGIKPYLAWHEEQLRPKVPPVVPATPPAAATGQAPAPPAMNVPVSLSATQSTTSGPTQAAPAPTATTASASSPGPQAGGQAGASSK